MPGFGIKLRNVLTNNTYLFLFWILLAIVATLLKYNSLHGHNNYLIFKYTFLHALEAKPLYKSYLDVYFDSNHYGPFFCLLFAPFALLNNLSGMLLWQIVNVCFLFYALKQLPFSSIKINAVMWIISHELLTALYNFQFNISIAAIIVLAFVYIEKNNLFKASFLIALGTFVKLYGIVGLAFFWFIKKKWVFILCLAFCFLFFLGLPMLFFGVDYILKSYAEWYQSIVEKQDLNASLTSMQDLSVMGMVRRIFGNTYISNLPFLCTGLFIFALPYLRIRKYECLDFKLLILASTLIFTVIFSNSSESSTYIIAYAGVAIWFVNSDKHNRWNLFLLICSLLLSLSSSDLFPKYLRINYIQPYSLKALPCLIIWLTISYNLLFKNFKPQHRYA